MRAVGSAGQSGRKRLVLAEKTGDVGAERHDAGTGKRCHVDADLGFEFGGAGQGVSQNQSAFGVGVEHFNRKTA